MRITENIKFGQYIRWDQLIRDTVGHIFKSKLEDIASYCDMNDYIFNKILRHIFTLFVILHILLWRIELFVAIIQCDQTLELNVAQLSPKLPQKEPKQFFV